MAIENSPARLQRLKADQLTQENRLPEAHALYTEICRADPSDAEALINLSTIDRRLGRFRQAEAGARQAVRLRPGFALSHFTLAAALHSLGRLDEALAGYRRAIEIEPGFARAHYLLGNILYGNGRLSEAQASYRRAIALQPDFFEALNNLGGVLTNLGLLDEAAESLQRALELRPDSPETLTNLACVAERADRFDESLALYQRALRARPDAVDILARQAALLEKLGRTDEARQCIERGLSLSAGHPVLALAAAKLARREGRIRDATSLLEAVDTRNLGHDVAGEIMVLLGQLHDKLNDAARAFPLFVEGKRRLAMAALATETDASLYLEKIESANRYFGNTPARSINDADDPASDSPAFLVGFPRSGTTLLGQILDSHPALQTLEEKPAVDAMEQAFLDQTGGRADALANLGSDDTARLRQVYFDEVARHIRREPGTMLVDKLPLNIAKVPLIRRIFPQARFILALRHPCDVCLSCFMQSFHVNQAMASFFTLENTARTYARVMELWRNFERLLPLHYRRVHYEDMVENLEAETRALLDFLGVGWNDAVLDHVQHTRRRGFVNTPSYHQVTQPIYRDALYRWKRYAREFEPLMPILQPYIEYFGYSEDSVMR